MRRILIAECKQEVSTFNPAPSSYDDIELIPTWGASSNTSGGVLGAADFDRLLQDFDGNLSDVGAIDGVYFCLHGAMQAANEHDPEGALLQRLRQRVGDDVPIVISLDIHGILTDRMLSLVDAVVVYHTYPHIDFFETGARAARVLLRILRDGARPVMARVKIPALVRGDEMITATGAVSEVHSPGATD